MLSITTDKLEFYDETKQEFVTIPAMKLDFEHSLASLSKWEEKWEKPFLSNDVKTDSEAMDYVRFMLRTPNVPDLVMNNLSQKVLGEIDQYIQAKKTATWFSDTSKKPPSRDVVTSELIYYWMVSLSIPWEAQDWHLNRLLTLIRVCNEKNNPNKKKLSRAELAARNRALNEQRRAKTNSTG